MKTRKLRNSLLLVLAALIWGVAFVAQSAGGEVVGPITFNTVRMLLGSLVLLPVITIRDRVKMTGKEQGMTGGETSTYGPVAGEEKKNLLLGGLSCGAMLFLASNLQQIGINMGVAAGKAGFLTACYILLVPILGIFLHKRCGINIWIGVVLTLGGLYLLCINGAFRLELADTLIILCALCFAVQILLVDYFAPRTDGVRLAALQFLVCGLCGLLPMLVMEMRPWAGGLQPWLESLSGWDAWIPILYAGCLSCGVAYTLQIVGQENLNPTVASLLMSLESVFSVLAGWLILGEILSGKELIGCGLIFLAVVLAQIPGKQE